MRSIIKVNKHKQANLSGNVKKKLRKENQWRSWSSFDCFDEMY